MASYLRPDVIKMKAYTPGEQINDATKLNTNECAWGPAPGVLKALANLSVDALRLYPSPLSDKVRAAASDVFQIDADCVLVGNGSDDCLTVVMRSFLGPGDVVACPWPTYSLYDTLATIQGVQIKHADWVTEPDAMLDASARSGGGAAGWHLPVSQLLATGAKVVFVATPNNPSATLVPLEELELLASKLQGVLVVDEAYIDYATAADGSTPAGLAASFIPRLAKYPNVIVLRTFSKSYSMAGAVRPRAHAPTRPRAHTPTRRHRRPPRAMRAPARAGPRDSSPHAYAARDAAAQRLGLMFASAELIGHMNKVKDSYNVNSMTQVAGEAALRDRDYFDWLVRATITERQWLLENTAQFGWSYPKTDANFVLFDVGSAARADYLYAGLKKQGLLVRYWGSRPDLCTKLRVTVGTRASNEKFVELCKSLLASEPATNGVHKKQKT